MSYQALLDAPWEEMEGNRHGNGRDRELRIILVGKTGGGKSATGNTILGREEFESLLGPNTTTLTCQRGYGTWHNMEVSVIDTAAIFDSEFSIRESVSEIKRCIAFSQPGPHALVLVTQVGRFTAEDEEAAKQVLDMFGAEAVRHMIVLFTRKEDLRSSPLQDYVEFSDNRALQELMQKCGKRYCAFNNRATGEERERQVSELMEMVQMIRKNRGHYVNQLYVDPNLTDARVTDFITQNRREEVRMGLNKRWIIYGVVTIGGVVLLLSLLLHYS